MSECDEKLQGEALRWFTRARAGDFGADEQQRLADWLVQDARHRNEYELLRLTWARVGELEHRLARSPLVSTRQSVLRRPVMFAFTACVIVASTLLLLRQMPITYESAPGKQSSVQIAEGIRVELDADSEIKVSRLPFYPDVTLTRGSAYFDVQAEQSGLRVHAADAALRDIGTRFAVTVLGGEGQVAVAEGMIEVSAAAGQKMLQSGQQTRFTASRIDAPTPCDLQQVAAWKNGEYRFAVATLAEVADAVWRHNRMRIEIPDAYVASLTVSGNFDIGQPEKLLSALAQIHDLQVRKQGGGYRLLPNS